MWTKVCAIRKKCDVVWWHSRQTQQERVGNEILMFKQGVDGIWDFKRLEMLIRTDTVSTFGTDSGYSSQATYIAT